MTTTTNATLTAAHYKELIEKRQLPLDWVLANCRSITKEQASEVLGYESQSAGILLQGCSWQIQFKPDKPWASEGKKPPKYRTPKEYDGTYDAIFPDHPTKAYWHDLKALKQKCWQVDGHPFIIVTEGLFKAMVGCSHELPTIALMGVEMGLTSAKADPQGKRYLVPTLERLAKAGFGFIIAFDADCASNPNVVRAEQKLAHQLQKFNVPVRSITGLWNIDQGKGMDEFIQNAGVEEFRQRLIRAFERPSESDSQSELNNLRRSRGLYKQRYHAIEQFWGSKLRFNTLKQQVELDGEPLDLDFVRPTLCIELDIDIPKEEAVEIVLTLARKNSYCPIAEYLERVEAAHTESGINFDSLAKYLLGTDDPLHAVYLKRHLIGSVARALNPGCQMDTALILQGIQGIGKSSFFRALYGDEFFDDTMAEASDKDELMKLHQHWAVEWAEFETQLSRKGYSRLKQFMTTKVDNYRPPYGRMSKSFRRHSVLVGSTNEAEFLNDPSGDRRYWVIPVKSKIDARLAGELRDRIWAAATVAYRSGEQWWLTEQERQLAEEANKPFRVSDTWEEFIQTYLKDRSFVTIAQILDEALEIESGKQDKGSQQRAASILRRLGWEKGREWVNGTRKKGWLRPKQFSGPSGPPLDEVGPVVGPPLETSEIKAFTQGGPSGPTIGKDSAELSQVLEEIPPLNSQESLVLVGPLGPAELIKSPEPFKTEVLAGGPTSSEVVPPLTETYEGLALGDRVEYVGNSKPAQKKFGGQSMTVIGFNRRLRTVVCSSPAGSFEGGHWTVRKVEADRCEGLRTETSSDRE